MFDWNGTLFDDVKAAFAGANFQIKQLGGKEISFEQYRNTFTIPLPKFFKANNVPTNEYLKNLEKYQQDFFEFYSEKGENCCLRKGAKEVLRELKKRGIKAAVLSAHRKKDILEKLEEFGISHLIDAVEAVEGNITGMAKGKEADRALKELGVKAEEAIIVGDGLQDIEAAKEHGMKAISIGGGFISGERLKKAGTDYFVKDLGEVLEIVEEINS